MNVVTILLFLPLLALGDATFDLEKFCNERSSVILKVACLKAVKNATFSESGLKVCSNLKNETAIIRCFQIERDDDVSVDLLKNCDALKTQWEVIDCLKLVSNKDPKTFSEGGFSGVYDLPEKDPVVVQNLDSIYYSPSMVLSLTMNVFDTQAKSRCESFRTPSALNKNWQSRDCWSTHEYTFTYPPMKTSYDPPLGYRRYNHCSVKYRCATE